MTTVHFSLGRQTYRMTANGHAGHGPHGSDIVCAAVSMLAQALIASVLESNDVERLGGVLCADGVAEINVTATEAGNQRMKARFEMAMRGFELLAEKYPENVRCEGRNLMEP